MPSAVGRAAGLPAAGCCARIVVGIVPSSAAVQTSADQRCFVLMVFSSKGTSLVGSVRAFRRETGSIDRLVSEAAETLTGPGHCGRIRRPVADDQSRGPAAITQLLHDWQG